MQIFREKYWRLLPILPLVMAFGFYFPATDFGYVWDDRDLLLRSPNLRNWDLIWSAVGQAFLNYQVYFRPLPLLSLGLEQLWSDGSSFVSHLNAIILFSINCALVAILGAVVAKQRLIGAKTALTIGLGTGCLYALHPALIESVAWISCRFDLLLTFFGLWALLADRLVPGTISRAVAVGVLFFLAALSKEMALGIALSLPVLHLLLSPTMRAKELIRHSLKQGHLHVYASLLISGTAYLCLRYWSLKDLYLPATTGYEAFGFQHLLVVSKSVGAYLRYAAWPFTGLSPLHTLHLPLTPTDFLVSVGAVYSLAVGLLLISAIRGYRGALCFLLLFSAALMPVINIFPLQIADNYMHERFLNFPLIFFCMGMAFMAREVIATGGQISRDVRSFAISALALVWLALSILNLRAGLPFWRDSISLWTLADMREPSSRMAQTNLQTAYIGAGLFEEAVKFTEQLQKRRNGQLHFEQVENYMLALSGLGRSTRDLIPPMLQRIRAVDPERKAREFAGIYATMAWLYLVEGRITDAQLLYADSLQILPLQPAANYGMAIAYMAQDRPDLAQPYYDVWLQYAHSSSVPYSKAEIFNIVSKVKRAQAALLSPKAR